MVVSRKPPAREFYAIGEVCEMFSLKPHVLRYWETQFSALAPVKNRQGMRLYRGRDLELIALIQRLVHEERYTVEGARARIAEMKAEGTEHAAASSSLTAAFLRSLRGELEAIRTLLAAETG